MIRQRHRAHWANGCVSHDGHHYSQRDLPVRFDNSTFCQTSNCSDQKPKHFWCVLSEAKENGRVSGNGWGCVVFEMPPSVDLGFGVTFPLTANCPYVWPFCFLCKVLSFGRLLGRSRGVDPYHRSPSKCRSYYRWRFAAGGGNHSIAVGKPGEKRFDFFGMFYIVNT